MKKALLLLGILSLWTGSAFGSATGKGPYRNEAGTRLDTIYVIGDALDSLAFKLQDADSIGYWKYLQGVALESTFVAFSTDKKREGVFARAFRASNADNDGTVGDYSILALPFNNGNRSTYTYGNPVWFHYTVVTDPPGDTDTSDVSLLASTDGSTRREIQVDASGNVDLNLDNTSGTLDSAEFGERFQQVLSKRVRVSTATAGAATTITLDAGASSSNDFYNGLRVLILAGTGAGQDRGIIDYDGGLQRATVDTNWITNPSGTSVFVLYGSSGSPQTNSNFVWNTGSNSSRTITDHTGLTEGNLDVAVSSRMATYTQPTGFLATTFPAGTVASTTNIIAGTITTATNVANPVTTTAADKQALKDTLRKLPNNSSFLPNLDFELSDVTGLNNTPTGWIENGATASEHISSASVPGAKQGRFCFTPEAGSHLTRDSSYLGLGHRLYFGGWMWASATSWTINPALRVLRTGGGAITLPIPTQADSWTWRDTVVTITTAGVYRINIFGEGDADSFFVDDIRFVSIDPGDTMAIARITRDSVWKSNLNDHDNVAGSFADSSGGWGQTGAGGGGGCTVTFSAGAGNRTVTITTRDSTSMAVVDGAIVTIIDSTTHEVKGNLPAVSGLTTFTLNDGGYYIKTSKTGYRSIRGSNPNPQDSIYLRVNGNTTRTDTIVGVAQILPVVPGKTNVYGYVQDILGDSVVEGVEIEVSYYGQGQGIKCCAGDTSLIMVGRFTATTRPNDNGRWEFNLYPSAKLVPATQYRFVFRKGSQTYLSKPVTVPDSGSWRFQY